jgi:hypothetical protein
MTLAGKPELIVQLADCTAVLPAFELVPDVIDLLPTATDHRGAGAAPAGSGISCIALNALRLLVLRKDHTKWGPSGWW